MKEKTSLNILYRENPIIEDEFTGQSDIIPIELIAKTEWSDPQQKLLSELAGFGFIKKYR